MIMTWTSSFGYGLKFVLHDYMLMSTSDFKAYAIAIFPLQYKLYNDYHMY